MPELPEVETTVRELRPRVTGRRVRSVAVSPYALRRPWFPEWARPLTGRRIRDVHRRGKWIILDLDTDADAEQIATLTRLTERYCVIYQTLKNPPALEICSPP